MQVQILYPTLEVQGPRRCDPCAPPAYRYGPFPVIVFAHGFDVDPNTYRALLVSWVEAGYVVVAPFFPDTSVAAIEAQHGADTESDMFNQPGDVAFVVSQVVEAGHGTPPPYAAFLVGLVDPSRLILAGQSDGADTVAALLYDHAYASTLASMAARPRPSRCSREPSGPVTEDVYSAPPGGGPPALVVQSLDRRLQRPRRQLRALQHADGDRSGSSPSTTPRTSGPMSASAPPPPTVERVTASFFDLATGWSKTGTCARSSATATSRT